MLTLKNGTARLIPAAVALAALVSGLHAQPGATTTPGVSGFLNIADTTTQRFISFGAAPAINNAGAVAFTAFGVGFLPGAAFKSDHNSLTTIATSADGVLAFFGQLVAITPGGAIAFSATLANSGNAIIGTGKGEGIKVIVDANQQGIFGRFLGVGGMNNSGTVVFLATRLGFASQAILAGDGGPLSLLVDTRTSRFTSLGNVDINASGTIAFRGFLADGTEGIFSGADGSTVATGSQFLNFGAFLDPVINDGGTVGSAALLAGGGAVVFTSKEGRITPRTDPASPLFRFADNVCINNSGHVAFFADSATGERAIFIEMTGGDSPSPVIRSGDPLFGSTVTSLNLGTHSLNDYDQISFQYTLADGRSGIAIASPHRP